MTSAAMPPLEIFRSFGVMEDAAAVVLVTEAGVVTFDVLVQLSCRSEQSTSPGALMVRVVVVMDAVVVVVAVILAVLATVVAVAVVAVVTVVVVAIMVLVKLVLVNTDVVVTVVVVVVDCSQLTP